VIPGRTVLQKNGIESKIIVVTLQYVKIGVYMKGKYIKIIIITSVIILIIGVSIIMEYYQRPMESKLQDINGYGYLFTTEKEEPIRVSVNMQAGRCEYLFNNQQDFLYAILDVNGYKPFGNGEDKSERFVLPLENEKEDMHVIYYGINEMYEPDVAFGAGNWYGEQYLFVFRNLSGFDYQGETETGLLVMPAETEEEARRIAKDMVKKSASTSYNVRSGLEEYGFAWITK